MSRDAQPKKKPLGSALDWNGDDLDRLAGIVPADETRASARATDDMRDLVEAPTVEPTKADE